ncbi:permease [Sphingomonas sp. SUN019]|uniref:cell division protein FtsX n=1 Tax=Sphingomonas sp. SUN019 TaxID=2937788 RepID=UPI0021640582|nr:permease [Sphingomonas sp. SUN019]UVO51062.1 permease [Sphingomonas sp. SUN019]
MSGGHTTRLLDDAGGVRAMTWVIAIMLFLTVLAAALGLATRSAARSLEGQLAGRLTVQIVEGDPGLRERLAARALAAVRASPDVAHATPVDRAELARLLRPWLGDDGADPELPVPAMIDIDLKSADAVSAARVRARVTAAVPSARIDAHEAWMSPVTGFMRLMTWLAIGLVLLTASATAAVVMLAARAGLDAHRATIEVMHMLGSTDVQVARLFQRRIARDAMIGGLVGGGLALGVTAFLGTRLAALGSELLGQMTLGAAGWAALALLPVAFVILAALAARVAVTRTLGRML